MSPTPRRVASTRIVAQRRSLGLDPKRVTPGAIVVGLVRRFSNMETAAGRPATCGSNPLFKDCTAAARKLLPQGLETCVQSNRPRRPSGDLTGRGAGAVWKARGTFTGVGIVSSSLRHGSLTGAASGLASKAKGTHEGVAIDTSGFHHFRG